MIARPRVRACVRNIILLFITINAMGSKVAAESFGDYYSAARGASSRYRDANRYTPREIHRAFNYRYRGENYLAAQASGANGVLYVYTSWRGIIYCRDMARYGHKEERKEISRKRIGNVTISE